MLPPKKTKSTTAVTNGALPGWADTDWGRSSTSTRPKTAIPKVTAHATRLHSIRVAPARKRTGISEITWPTSPPTKTEPSRSASNTMAKEAPGTAAAWPTGTQISQAITATPRLAMGESATVWPCSCLVSVPWKASPAITP